MPVVARFFGGVDYLANGLLYEVRIIINEIKHL